MKQRPQANQSPVTPWEVEDWVERSETQGREVGFRKPGPLVKPFVEGVMAMQRAKWQEKLETLTPEELRKEVEEYLTPRIVEPPEPETKEGNSLVIRMVPRPRKQTREELLENLINLEVFPPGYFDSLA